MLILKLKQNQFALHYIQCNIERIFIDQLEKMEWQTF